jgi:hypothetical protein
VVLWGKIISDNAVFKLLDFFWCLAFQPLDDVGVSLGKEEASVDVRWGDMEECSYLG